MVIQTFKRHELKYLVSQEQFDLLVTRLQAFMDFDSYCPGGACYPIYNLYFDTPDNAVIRRSLAKPYYKEKLRLRSYHLLGKATGGAACANDDLVFLELKKKIGGVVAKRRAVLAYSAALRFVATGEIPPAERYQDRQVLAEIADFLARNDVAPKAYISYERVAFFGKYDNEFRVSFDKAILTRRDHVNLIHGDYGAALLPEDTYLMEVKCAGSMPLWFTALLSQLHLYAASFSKYGEEYKRSRRFTRHRAA